MNIISCEDRITKIILKAGALIRELKGLPPEKNITKLYQEVAPIFGVEIKFDREKEDYPTHQNSAMPSLLSTCPECGKEAYLLSSLCNSCAASEGGKYKSIFRCRECKYEERSETPTIKWLDKLGVKFENQSKKSLGIKTLTDEGLKE